jgi:AraC-like DNA-binding protein
MPVDAPPRDLPPELTPHCVFADASLEHTRAAVGRTIASHRIDAERGEEVRAHLYAAEVGGVSINYLRYGAAVRIESPHLERFFAVQVPLAGRAEIVSAGDRVLSSPAMASVTNPGTPLRMRWDRRIAYLIVKIAETDLERQLTRQLGRAPDEPIAFAPGLAFTGASGARWRAIHQLLLAEVAQGEASASPGASCAVVEELVLSSLLLGHHSNYWDRLRRAGDVPAGPRYVRRALEYARAHLDGPLTVADVAEAAGVSVRTLQAGFQKHLDGSPTSYIRDLRLDRAHAELLEGDPYAGPQVTDVALRWGFSHFGRFAALYRRRFGERPSETLRR